MQETQKEPTTAEPITAITYHRFILVQPAASPVRDWLPWSIVNLFIGWLLLGFLPLFFSITCRSQRRRNDVDGARTSSKLALGFNIMVTALAVLGWSVLIVISTTYPHLIRKNADDY